MDRASTGGDNPPTPVGLKTCPPFVYRFLDKKEYAKQFARGQIRLSTFGACRAYEDQRADQGEGTIDYTVDYATGDATDPHMQIVGSRAGVYIGPGSKNITLRNGRSHRFIPDAWLLCLTGRCEAGIRKQYGDFGIRIDEPLEFWNLLSRAVVLRTRARLRSYLGWVRYTGRSYQGLGPLPGHPSLLKPSVPYGEEREFRMLWIPKDGYVIKEPHLSINEPALARFCTVL